MSTVVKRCMRCLVHVAVAWSGYLTKDDGSEVGGGWCADCLDKHQKDDAFQGWRGHYRPEMGETVLDPLPTEQPS